MSTLMDLCGPKGIWAVDHKNPDGIAPVKFYPVAGLHMKVMNDLFFYKVPGNRVVKQN